MTQEEDFRQFCRISYTSPHVAPKTLVEAYCLGRYDRQSYLLWDYYAAHALSGLLRTYEEGDLSRYFVKYACEIADAMLVEREKRGIK